MTGVIGYGCGNLFSLICSLKKIGERAEVFTEPDEAYKYERVILPGVGAFGGAAIRLKSGGMDKAVLSLAKKGVPVLGICLGMQMLFERSYEYGEHEGLKLLKGEIRSLSEATVNLKIPHIGWNALNFKNKSPLFRYVGEGEYVYFVHSYHAKTDEKILATVCYGTQICAAAGGENVYGVQFHNKKSGDTGLRILKGFIEL